MKTRPTTRNRNGFTFAELIVAGTTVSVLLSVFGPKFTSTMDHHLLRNAADEFVTAGQRARAVAVQHGRTAQVMIEGSRVWVEADTTQARTGDRTIFGDIIDFEDAGIALESTVTTLCFDSRGLAPTRGACAGTGGTLELSKGNSSKTVAVMATGFMLK